MSASRPTRDEVRFASRVARAGFTVGHNVVLFDRGLSPAARLLYLQLRHYGYLAEHASREIPDQAEMAGNLGIKERALRPYIAELVDAGLLRVQRRGRGLSNRYTVMEPKTDDRQNTAGLDRQSTTAQSGSLLPVSIREKQRRKKEAPPAPPPDGGGVESDSLEIELALSVELGVGPVTSSEKRSWRRVARDLARCGATAGEVKERCAEYRRVWPSARLTPTGLARHWSMLGGSVDLEQPAGKSLEAWIEKTAWQLDETQVADILESRGMLADEITAITTRCAALRVEHQMADNLTAALLAVDAEAS